MPSVRTYNRSYNVRVAIEPVTGMGDYGEYEYGDTIYAYGAFSVRGRGVLYNQPGRGMDAERNLSMRFPPGEDLFEIRSANGRYKTIPLGSRVTIDSHEYFVRNLDPQYDTASNRYYEQILILTDAGPAATVAAETVTDEREITDRGVDHDIRPHPRRHHVR